MVVIGYTLLGEQAGPTQLVEDAVHAEQAGFDFVAASDHYFPWLDEQGHAPYTWAVLGAVAQATERIELMTFVTCPTMRYHPAVVAQKAATVQLLADGRFTLGVGAGENLNEHVIGEAWPPVDVRHQMLDEALQIIRSLFEGGTVTFRGEYLATENAKLWDLPPEPPRIAVAASGPESCELAGRRGDALIAVQPEARFGQLFDDAGGRRKPRFGQAALSFDLDEAAATKRAREQFRWFASGWDVMAELPGTRHFAAASQTVREDDITRQIPCGPDVAAHVEAVQKYVDAGFTHVAVVQVGGDTQSEFLEWAAGTLLPELHRLS
jgi:G6PDH family F420-dependent oxidoreductase